MTDEEIASVDALIAEQRRRWEALRWDERLRLRFESWRGELFLKKKFSDEEMAQFPALAETQREWDALARREKLWQRFESSREYGLWRRLRR